MNTVDILHLATLARLELTKEEQEAFPGQIEEVINFVGKIKGADLPEGIVRDMQNCNTLADDVSREGGAATRERIVAGFPQSADDMLRVSKILPN